MPGKGAFIEAEIRTNPAFEKLWHGYNVLYQVR
jgi:hypothetical protein